MERREVWAGFGFVIVATICAAAAPVWTALGPLNTTPWYIRAALVAAIGLAGLYLTQRAGLRVVKLRWSEALGVSIIGAVVLATAATLLDAVIFRSVLPASYLALVHRSTAERLMIYVPLSFAENVVYRLLLMAGLVALVRRQRGAMWAVIAGAAVIQLVWELGLLSAGVVSTDLVAFWLLRYAALSAIKYYMFWKYDFNTVVATSIITHLFMEPVYGALF